MASDSSLPSSFPPAPGHLDRALRVVEYLRIHSAWARKQTARHLVGGRHEAGLERVPVEMYPDRRAIERIENGFRRRLGRRYDTNAGLPQRRAFSRVYIAAAEKDDLPRV